EDRRVREVLTAAYDFERLNRPQFHYLYRRTTSFFEGGELASSGAPRGLELEILETVRDEVPPELFTEPFTLPVHDSPQASRQHLRRASELLAEAGWKQQGRQLVNEKGEPFRIEFLSSSPDAERTTGPYINTLRRLGIDASLRIIDASQYVNRVRDYDFDVITSIVMQSQSPGNEQREFWSSQAADLPDTRNFAGIKNPAVDKLVDRIIFAE